MKKKLGNIEIVRVALFKGESEKDYFHIKTSMLFHGEKIDFGCYAPLNVRDGWDLFYRGLFSYDATFTLSDADHGEFIMAAMRHLDDFINKNIKTKKTQKIIGDPKKAIGERNVKKKIG